MTQIALAFMIVDKRCATTRVVLSDSVRSLSRASWTIRSLSESKALVASSNSSTFGCFRMARAMAMRCFWPPLSCTPRSPTSVDKPSGRCSMNSQAFARMHAL
mmetsp:Transcript_72038/g.128104  ORF Transcript_72038/g.128104 Transcript_72038/m.128104 type:complete len:103 (+) Transcript_72038:116-424(+)